MERGERTASDLASLLVELSRAVRGLSFYKEGDPVRGQLIDRAWLAWSGELQRAGAIEFWIEGAVFGASGLEDTVPVTHRESLAEALARHEIERVGLADSLTRDALRAFLELLGQRSESLRRAGGLADALARRCGTGILLNGRDLQPPPVPTGPIELPPLPPGDSLGSALLAPTRDLAPVRSLPTSDEKATVDDRPLDAPAEDNRGDRLRVRLIELDRCSDDSAYEFLGRRVVAWAIELFDAGLAVACHRAVLVLADHAVGAGGRSGIQARIAHRLCAELAAGARLEALIDRACSSDTGERIRATQVLLQLGDHAVPAIFDRIAADPGTERCAQLAATMVTLGDAAVPHLARVLAGTDDTRAILAIRLAAELQHPSLVKPIAAALDCDRDAVRREAARALAERGGDDAVHALVNALSSDREGLPDVAAHWLGSIQDPRAVQPLLAALERATRNGDGGVRARAMIRALGALGSERATPRLVALLERRSLLRRRPLRQLQVCALEALQQLSGREAARAVDRARRHRDPEVRERAIRLMKDAAAQSRAAHA